MLLVDLILSLAYYKTNMNKIAKDKPVTLSDLSTFAHKVLFPSIEERVVTKNEFAEFKDNVFTNFDSILKKLDVLIDEKVVAGYQWEKNKKLLLVIIKALKEHNILTQEELKLIKKLEVF